MLRLALSLIISVSVARWLYSEMELVAPPLVPVVNYVLDATTIPTHDKWSKDSFETILRAVDGVAQVAVTSLKERNGQKAREQEKRRPVREKPRGPSPMMKQINEQLAELEERLARQRRNRVG